MFSLPSVSTSTTRNFYVKGDLKRVIQLLGGLVIVALLLFYTEQQGSKRTLWILNIVLLKDEKSCEDHGKNIPERGGSSSKRCVYISSLIFDFPTVSPSA